MVEYGYQSLFRGALMMKQLDDVEFDTWTIGPLVLTTPVSKRLRFQEIVNLHCSIANRALYDLMD
jgi:hypothetical protein